MKTSIILTLALGFTVLAGNADAKDAAPTTGAPQATAIACPGTPGCPPPLVDASASAMNCPQDPRCPQRKNVEITILQGNRVAFKGTTNEQGTVDTPILAKGDYQVKIGVEPPKPLQLSAPKKIRINLDKVASDRLRILD